MTCSWPGWNESLAIDPIFSTDPEIRIDYHLQEREVVEARVREVRDVEEQRDIWFVAAFRR